MSRRRIRIEVARDKQSFGPRVQSRETSRAATLDQLGVAATGRARRSLTDEVADVHTRRALTDDIVGDYERGAGA